MSMNLGNELAHRRLVGDVGGNAEHAPIFVAVFAV